MSYDSVGFGFNSLRDHAFDPFADDFDGYPFTCSIRSHPKYLDGESFDRLGAAVDWKETPEAHIFKVDLPGLTKKEVTVAVEGGVLKISGERRCEMVQDTDTWHSMERCTGLFLRRFRLPENAELENVSATMENGVLTVTVAKDESKKAEFKSIEISD